MNNMNKIIAGAALLCLFASNVHALGGGPKAYEAGGGINIKGFQINPSVTVAGLHDDNFTLAETQPISTFGTIVNPAIDITAGSEINQIIVHYDFERGYFFSSSGDDYSDHYVSGVTHNELTSRAVIDTEVSYTKSHDRRGTTFSGIITGFDTPDRWHETAATAQFSYGSANRIVVDGGFSAKRYDNHRSLTAGRELNTAYGGATFYYRIASKTSALFEGIYTNYDYRLANSPLDSHELTLYTGLTWEATAKTTGTVKAGWQREKFKRGTQSGNGFFSLDAEIAWSPLTYSIWTLQAGSRAQQSDSNGTNGSYIKTKDVHLAWTHEWNDRLSHTAHAGYAHDRYIGTVRKDNSIFAGAGLQYALTRWLSIGIAYDYVNRASNTVNAAYHQNVYSGTITGAL